MTRGRRIRIAEARDAPAIAAIYAPAVVGSAISFETEAPTGPEMEERLDAVLGFAPWLVCVDPIEAEPESLPVASEPPRTDAEAAAAPVPRERVSGYAYASRHRERAAYGWCVDVSVYVHADCRRAGVGRALYTSLFALLRAQGFYAAHAGIRLPNVPSVRMHEALGFRRIGVYPRVGFKCGAWRDVGWWQLELRERTDEPSPPLSMDDLRRSDRWDEAIAAGEALDMA